MNNDLELSREDFAFAGELMDIVVKAGQHGPLYQKLASAAGQELKAMIKYEPKPATITPAAGPANAIRVNEDGTETDLAAVEALNKQARIDEAQAAVIARREALLKEREDLAREEAAMRARNEPETRDPSGKPTTDPVIRRPLTGADFNGT